MPATQWVPISAGRPGIAVILGRLAALKSAYGASPAIRAAAIDITRPTRNDDQASQLLALAAFVRSRVVYVADPLNLEFIQSPDRMLLDIAHDGRARGDCDDHVLLFAALCEALGIPCDIAAVAAPGNTTGTPDHVIAVAQLRGVPMDFDLCAKGQVQPYYAEKMFAHEPVS